MKKLSKKIRVLIVFIILFVFSSVFIIINGNTYTISINTNNSISNVEDFIVEIDDDSIIECTEKSIKDGIVQITINSKSKGKTFITFYNTKKDVKSIASIYVNRFGVITYNEFLGDFNKSTIVPISIVIFLVYILLLLIDSYKKSVSKNMYQYKNIAYLGMIVFLIFVTISQFFEIFNYNGLISTVNGFLNLFSFALALLPIAFVVSIFVIISNISLIRNEGFNIRNILGIVLGVALCFCSILPDLLYNMLYSASWIDVHNQNGAGLYIYNMVESSIYITITYIECVLIGTIIMGFKSARHIPRFDKDFIIILGCQIRKDGSLTNLLKSRVDRAIEFDNLQKEKNGKEVVFVPSGGKGKDEVASEAQAMKNYLIEQGIDENRIIIEDKSSNTFENINFSNKIIKEKNDDAKVAFSTTNYHVLRAGSIATEQELDFEGIGAKTKSYFWINAFIREFVATLIFEKKKHIFVLLSILFVVILMIGITCINSFI